MKKTLVLLILVGMLLLLTSAAKAQKHNISVEETKLLLRDSILKAISSDSALKLLKDEAKKLMVVSFKDVGIKGGIQTVQPDLLSQKHQILFHSEYKLPVSIKDIPFQSFFTHNSLAMSPTVTKMNNLIGTMQFRKDEYLDMLKQKIEEKFNNGIKKELERKAASIEAELESKIKLELKKTLKDYDLNFLGSSLKPLDILQLNKEQLNDKVNSSALTEQVNQYKLLYQQLQERQKAGDVLKEGLVDSIKLLINKYGDHSKVIEKVLKVKEKFGKSDMMLKLNKIRELLKTNGTNLRSPRDIQNLASEHLNLKGLQQFFTYIQQLNTGQVTSSLSRLSMNGFNMNGVNMEALKRNKYLAIVAGFDNNFSNVWDNAIEPYRSSIVSNAKGVKFGTGEPGGTHSHVSIFNYFQQSQNENIYQLNNNLLLPLARSTNVFTYSQQIDFSSSSVQIELSKSLSKLLGANEVKEVANEQGSRSNFFQSLAFDATYGGTVEKWKLQHKVHVAFVAADYTNPGSIYLNRGLTEGMLELKKQFKKRKFQLGMRAIYRQLKSNPSSQNRSTNFYLNADGRVNFKRGQHLSFHYQPSSNYRYAKNYQGIIGENNRASIDGAFVANVFQRQYRNQLNFIAQNSSFLSYDKTFLHARTISFISSQTLLLSSNVLAWNTIYSKADQTIITPLLTTSLFSELGYTYKIFNKVNCSSGLLYQGYKHYQHQAGIRNSVSLDLNQTIQASLFADLRTSFGPGQKDALLNNQRIEINFSYNFKN